MADIKQIQVGTITYDIADTYARDRLEGLSTVYSISCNYTHASGNTYVDWDTGSDVASTAMTIKNDSFKSTADEITVSGAETGTSAYLVLTSTKSANKYYVKLMTKMRVGDTVYVIEDGSIAADRWLSSFTSSPLSATFKALNEKIDLSEYAKKTEAGKAGTYTSSAAGAHTVTEPAYTATGSVTFSYDKANSATGSAGGATINTTSAGSATVNTTSAGSATVDFTKASFAGTSATIEVSASAVTLEDHSFTPAGTVSAVVVPAHSHGLASSTVANNVTGTETGSAGAHTHNVSVSGTITLAASAVTTATGTATYTPGGTISNTYTAASTTPVLKSITAELDATPTFTGTAATISISGDVAGTAVADHAAASLTVSGSQAIAAHSHTVNAATTTVVNSVATATGENGDHTHTITGSVDSHTHAAAQTVLTSESSFTANGNDTFVTNELQSLTTKNYGFSASQSDIMTAPTVSDGGVLSWTIATAGTQDVLSAGKTASFTQGTKASFTAKTASVAGANSAATLSISATASTTGAHTHSIAAAGTINVLTGATLSTAGGATIQGSNFKAALPTLTHSVTQGSFSGSTNYTPAGTVTKPGITVSPVTVSVNTGAIKAVTSTFSGTGVRLEAAGGETSGTMTGTAESAGAHTHSLTNSTLVYVSGLGTNVNSTVTVTPTFTGTAATIAHSVTATTGTVSMTGTYTPVGSISGSQTIASHTHSVTVASHTHSVTISSHTHDISSTATSVTTSSVSVNILAHTHTIGNHTHSTTVSPIKAS